MIKQDLLRVNMIHLNKNKTILFVIVCLFTNLISIKSQEIKLHFFDLSKDYNLESIVAQLREDGFEEKEEQNESNIPSVCYTKSGEGQYIIFKCNYTPKTKHVASYWYKIYGGDLMSMLNELKSLYGEPNSDLEYQTLNSFEWQSQLVNIKLNIEDDYWIYYSYEDKVVNKQLVEELGRELSSGEISVFLFVIVLCLIGTLFAYMQYKHNKKKMIQEELYEFKRKEELAMTMKSNETFKKGLIEKYGTPTRTIAIQNNQGDYASQISDIIVFQQLNKIIIGKKGYNFCDIISCSLHDENSKNAIIAQTTRTKIGSMIGRAVVGALTFGVAGAVVGAVTAKKESTSTITPTRSGSYIVKIGLKSVKDPVLTLEFGSDKAKAEEVYTMMQAIIAMK